MSSRSHAYVRISRWWRILLHAPIGAVGRVLWFLFPFPLSFSYTTMSREGTPSSDTLIDIDNFDENEVTDLGLKNLLKREIELQLLIDALQTEISQLEERINGKDQGDEEDELDDQGMVSKYIVYCKEQLELTTTNKTLRNTKLPSGVYLSRPMSWALIGMWVIIQGGGNARITLLIWRTILFSHLQLKSSLMSLLLIHHGSLPLMLLLVV